MQGPQEPTTLRRTHLRCAQDLCSNKFKPHNLTFTCSIFKQAQTRRAQDLCSNKFKPRNLTRSETCTGPIFKQPQTKQFQVSPCNKSLHRLESTRTPGPSFHQVLAEGFRCSIQPRNASAQHSRHTRPTDACEALHGRTKSRCRFRCRTSQAPGESWSSCNSNRHSEVDVACAKAPAGAQQDHDPHYHRHARLWWGHHGELAHATIASPPWNSASQWCTPQVPQELHAESPTSCSSNMGTGQVGAWADPAPMVLHGAPGAKRFFRFFRRRHWKHDMVGGRVHQELEGPQELQSKDTQQHQRF